MESLNQLSEFEHAIIKRFPKHLNICNLNQFCQWYENNCICDNERNETNVNQYIEKMIITWINVSMYCDQKCQYLKNS
jgi:hypothetical protein